MNEYETDWGPYVDDTPIKGGDISYKSSSFAKYLLLALAIVIVLYVIYIIYIKYPYNGETYYQRNARYYFTNLDGETFDDAAKKTIENGEKIENPRAIDHYRIGTAYLVNANDPHNAYKHFKRALMQVIAGDVDVQEAPFILDRIDDYKDYFTDHPEIEELPIQQALWAHFEVKTNNNQTGRPSVNGEDGATQNVLLSKQYWQSESQNVHDSAIYEVLRNQYAKVRDENAMIPDIQTKDYNEARHWIKAHFANDPSKLPKAEMVLRTIDNNFEVSHIPNAHEQDVLLAVWQRAYDPGNKPRFNQIREALADSIVECAESGNIVCMSGRTTRVWQSLAMLDKDPEIGVLKSKQILRNEIYQRCSKIVDNYLGDNGTVSDDLKQTYQAGTSTAQVDELTGCIKKEIDGIRADYEGLLDKDQLVMILEECKAAI